MGTVATATKIRMSDASGGNFEGIFTVLLDTTTAAGLMTLDLTDYFEYVDAAWFAGELAATSNGYYVKIEKPAYDTALTSSNFILSFWECGADGDPSDPANAVDMSAVMTGMTIVVKGRQAI